MLDALQHRTDQLVGLSAYDSSDTTHL
jgi:hypothetical protein